MPVAVAGSIALAMTATAVAPAVAAEPAPQARTESRPHVASPGGIGSHVVVGRTAPASVQVPETYTVQRGDTVFGIALRYGLRTADVLALNGLDATSIITPGQVLRLVGSVPAPAAPAAPAAPVPPSGTYTIQKGDTLSAVAARHGTTVQALFAANGLDWSSILYPGQTVMLPGGSAPAAPAAPAPPAAPAAPPAAAVGTYTISQGDTLSAIAARHGISVQALFAANGLGWSSIIYPGQKVAIPSAMAPAASVAPAPPATSTPSPEAAPAEPVAPVEQAQPEQAPVPALDPEQQANVRLIIGIGRELGVPDRGIAIALGAAMQESWLRNLPWGDRDSLGLFQQRPSTGWGTAEQVSDPARATRAFFGGPDDPNGTTTRGLLDIAGWQDMTFSGAAQAVQISAYPDRYARWELAATTWLATYG
ncbi:LysM peptidoglycan-binding domain-containing protein [Microbacterium sp. BK668]|uniref:LysM peptidoglycan-binding domain-containing protein n=1 Tax=Microbacterium sp. BK668 TaxID=2512118 RepID=UPI00105D231D|nr:LysM peptidoglycan-binding domain-containing protein [Microbacterium sp. BK668]TDN93198.1 LysM repeat protein [Microbacterium sp. BK668]